jgi:hypothetical protein
MTCPSSHPTILVITAAGSIALRTAPGSDAITDADPDEGAAMSTIDTVTAIATLAYPAEDRVAIAASRLYDAEFALHSARQSGVDKWVAVAYDRLHDAVTDHRVAVALRDD